MKVQWNLASHADILRRASRVPDAHLRMSAWEAKWNLVDANTKGTCHSVRIIRVSV